MFIFEIQLKDIKNIDVILWFRKTNFGNNYVYKLVCGKKKQALL